VSGALSFAAAAARVMEGVPVLGSEPCALEEAAGRVLAEPLRAPLSLPPWDNSAMDGYAVRAGDVQGADAGSPRRLRVVGELRAGSPPGQPLGEGEAVRISTGAPVPRGCDTVIRVEHTRDEGDEVVVLRDDDAHRHVRPRGEDVREGEMVLAAGHPLTPARLALAASLGAARLAVHRRPRVAVLATGDELVPVEEFAAVREGRAIVNSNAHALAAQLRAAGAEPFLLPLTDDDPARIHAALDGATGCDALVTTAGMSMGEHDHLRDVLSARGGTLHFWRVRMRPGAPFAFGATGGEESAPWFGLPGNPVSSFVTFEVLVRPALLRMGGYRTPHRRPLMVEIGEPISVAPGLTHFLRVRLETRAGAPPLALLTGPQGSGILSSVARADALLRVDEGGGQVAVGELREAIPLYA
jgi:molybdopterin molybdotransferase